MYEKSKMKCLKLLAFQTYTTLSIMRQEIEENVHDEHQKFNRNTCSVFLQATKDTKKSSGQKRKKEKKETNEGTCRSWHIHN